MSPPIRDGSGNSIGAIRLGDGSEISEVRTGAGDVLFSGIPDSAVTQYRAEDENNTSTAIDSVGSNDAALTGTTYTTNSKVGTNALSHDGSNDETESVNANDLSAGGSVDGYGFAGWFNIQSNGSLANNYIFDVSNDSNNRSSLTTDGNGGVDFFVQVNGTSSRGRKFSASTNEFYHAACNFFSNGTLELIIHDNAGSQVFSDTNSTSLSPTGIGAMTYTAGYAGAFNSNFLNVIVDDYTLANEPLSTGDIDQLVSRGT